MYKLKKCKKCGKETRNKKFCSQSCAAIFNNIGIRRHGKEPKKFKCLTCNKEIISNRKRKFCSNECQGNYMYTQNIKKWLKNEISGLSSNGKNTSHFVKKYMIQTFGNKCRICNWSEINTSTGKIPIQLDHIDGNFRNCRPENLQLLCPNCHSLTSTFGSLNSKNGFNAMERRR